jgi:hypothetical protein
MSQGGGYDIVAIVSWDGQRFHIEQRIDEPESARRRALRQGRATVQQVKAVFAVSAWIGKLEL